VQFFADDGSDFVLGAQILAEVDGTPGTNDMPCRLTFSTTADGASAVTERMRIDSTGDVGIGTTNPTARLNVVDATSQDAVRITQTGTGNALVVEDAANPDSTPFVISADGNVTIGSTTQTTGSGYTPKVQLLGTSNALTSIGQYAFSASASSPINEYALSRSGTVGSHTVVQDGDTVGSLRFSGSDGTGFIRAAQIVVQVDGTPGTNDMPGRLIFSTTADGASAPSERMRITSAGNVGIGTTAPAEELHVSSGGAEFAIQWDSTGSKSWVLGSATGRAYIRNKTDNIETLSILNSGRVGIGTASPAVSLVVSSTDSIRVPVGTTGERPTGATGYLRFNTTTTSFEGFNGTAWGSIGGGAAGGGTDAIFYNNGQTVTTDYSIPSGQNAGTFGPITVNSGVTVTVPSGSTWSIV
jgi:hypothetical protein